jgi:hypothetical protein
LLPDGSLHTGFCRGAILYGSGKIVVSCWTWELDQER